MDLTLQMFNWQFSKLKSDKNVIRSARQLYRDLYNLAKEKGYCFATNRYLAEEYGVAKETVSRWVSSLKRQGYIDTEEIRDDYKRVIERRIYILKPKDMTFSSNEATSENENSFKSSIGIDENVKENKKLLHLKQEEEKKSNLSDSIFNAFKLMNQSISANEEYILSVFDKLYGTDFVLFAIEKSSHADYKIAYIRTLLSDWKNKNIQYIRTLLSDWKNKNIQSTSELITKITPFSKNKSNYARKIIRKELVPDWLKYSSQPQQSKPLTHEDQLKINRMKELQKQMLNF